MTPLAKKYGFGMIALSALVFLAFMTLIMSWHRRDTLKEATNQARDYYALNLHYRAWNASLGGVYAPVDKVAPNPFLDHPKRDISLADGGKLTLINPAYMTRMVFKRVNAASDNTLKSKLVSLKPLNPMNAANPWETAALLEMERNPKTEFVRVKETDGQEYLQFMGPFHTEQPCLTCHEHQGYKVGDLRGAISITIPMAGYQAVASKLNSQLAIALFLLWGSFSVIWARISKKRYDKEVALNRTKEELTKSKIRLERVTEQSRTIIWEVNPQGLYTYISPACERILGYRPEEIVGHVHFYDLYSEDSREDFKATAFDAFARQEQLINFSNQVRTKSGNHAWLTTNGMPVLDSNGALLGYRGSDMDVTTQKELECQNMRSAQLAAVGELASGIAHEINNPITGVINYAQLLLNKPHFTGNDREVLERIIKEGDRIASIVRGLLFFSRDSGKQRSVVVAQQVLGESLTLSRKQLEKEGIELILDLDETPLEIYANHQQLEQVWLNLISNARHALNDREGKNDAPKELHITMRSVALHGKMLCRTTFRDNGIGIPENILSQIFRPFFTTKPAGIGTGLGLSISQEIVKNVGGNLTIHSREGEFTQVTIDIPQFDN